MQRHIQLLTIAAHLRSLSLLLCLSLRWLSDIRDRAVFLVLLPDSPAESGAALATFTGRELWALPCSLEAADVARSSEKHESAHYKIKFETNVCMYLHTSKADNKTFEIRY